jgi:hypothetical protein
LEPDLDSVALFRDDVLVRERASVRVLEGFVERRVLPVFELALEGVLELAELRVETADRRPDELDELVAERVRGLGVSFTDG